MNMIFAANWHEWCMGRGDEMVDFWVRRSKVKVTWCWS